MIKKKKRDPQLNLKDEMLNLTCWFCPFFSHNPVTFFHILAFKKLTPTSSEKVNFYNFPHPSLHKIENRVSLDLWKCNNSEEGRGVYTVCAKKIKVFQGFVWEWRDYENFVNIVLICFFGVFSFHVTVMMTKKGLMYELSITPLDCEYIKFWAVTTSCTIVNGWLMLNQYSSANFLIILLSDFQLLLD